MRNYTFFWRDGVRQVLKGNGPADALTRAGYGGGALRALDFHAQGDNEEYFWNAVTHRWDKREQLPQLGGGKE